LSFYLETAGELNHLFGLDVLQTIDTGNTITNGQDTTGFLEVDFRVGTEDALFKDRRDFGGAGLSRSVSTSSSSNSTKVKTGL
jgi:hypothetical protein